MLSDRLVCGINDERIQRRLLSEGAMLTLEKAIDIESSSRQSALIQTYQQKVGMQYLIRSQINQGSQQAENIIAVGALITQNRARLKTRIVFCHVIDIEGH